MKNAIILHGMPGKDDEYYNPKIPSSSNKHWLPWLQKQLIVNDIKADTPEVPHAYEPEYNVWVKEAERFEIGPETILVGHSLGGGFWVKYLSLNKNLKVGKVILVAPWIDPDGDETRGFFDDYKIDADLAKRTNGLIIFNSDNDMGNVLKSVATIRGTIKDTGYREFHKYGHFCYGDMQTDQFPELLEECLSG
jgi:predicted alpha/beta hydrolase family esterase